MVQKVLTGGDVLRLDVDAAGNGSFRLDYSFGGYRTGAVANGKCSSYETFDSAGRRKHATCSVTQNVEGTSLVKWADGSSMLCTFEDMRPQGYYVHFYLNGNTQEGYHVDGVRDMTRAVFRDQHGTVVKKN